LLDLERLADTAKAAHIGSRADNRYSILSVGRSADIG